MVSVYVFMFNVVGCALDTLFMLQTLGLWFFLDDRNTACYVTEKSKSTMSLVLKTFLS